MIYSVSIETTRLGVDSMELEEFEAQTRNAIDKILNQLQTATLLIAELETQLSEAGASVQTLSQLVETFINERREDQSSSKK